MPRPQANQTGDEGNATSHWVSPCQFLWTQRWGGHQITVEREPVQAWGHTPHSTLAGIYGRAQLCSAASSRLCLLGLQPTGIPGNLKCLWLHPVSLWVQPGYQDRDSLPPKVLIFIEPQFAPLGNSGHSTDSPKSCRAMKANGLCYSMPPCPTPYQVPRKESSQNILLTDQDCHSDFTAQFLESLG